MWALAADVAPNSDGLTVAVIGLAGLVVTGVVTVIVALINKPGQPVVAHPEPDPPDDGEDDITVRERLSILEYRADTWDRADELHDRRLDQVERVLDLENPRWRHRP